MAALTLCFVISKAQNIYYPTGSSQLLQSTAVDVAGLLSRALPGSNFGAQVYTIKPSTGWIFVYDTLMTDNQACHVQGNGSNLLQFSAASDNGLCFGVYQYLQKLGFRFYQPGSIWEQIPNLANVFTAIDSTLTCQFPYKTWNISGGHNRWAMDNNNNYGWDTYFGANGHNWALYQRRNGMLGGYRFTGHRTDVMSASYLATLQNNPCYVACYDGVRNASYYSTPDINNTASMNLWGTAIQDKHVQYKNVVFNNTSLYSNLYHNFNYYNKNIGIEVSDGAQWGNSKDNAVCNIAGYPSASDQHFSLANFTAQKINAVQPGTRFQLYAYSSHADVPSASISLNPQLDIQVNATAFQNETSTKGLLNRWYNRSSRISEYHYLNIPQWGGETPMFYLNDLKATLQRAKEKNSQGVFWEASPAKFASLPFLLAANNALLHQSSVDSSLMDFCQQMFDGAGSTMYQLLQLWSDDKTISNGDFIQDNKYKLPLYFQLVKKAVSETQQSSAIVKERISELKAYLHYMVLYYDWLFDQRTQEAKQDKAAALCVYLAKINKLQLVNSYFLIVDITSRFQTGSSFEVAYNVNNGTAYQNGNLPLITASAIESNFINDASLQAAVVTNYQIKSASYIKSQFATAGMNPLKNIAVKVLYTNGYEYASRVEYYIDAAAAGSFSVKYFAQYQMPEKGYINFTVESTEQSLSILKDFSIGRADAPDGNFTVQLPTAGVYKLTITSKYKSVLDLKITTKGNCFYKNSAFLGNKIENYRANLMSLPGYFYVPAGLEKVFFSVNNGNPAGAGFASAAAIGKAFVFKDNMGNIVEPILAGNGDSALFYLPVSNTGMASFWQVFKMEQYNCCFANISNITWYAERKPCANANFTASLVRTNNECITRLTAATNNKTSVQWEIYDLGRWSYIKNQIVVDLPANTSPNAIITLTNGNGCMLTKWLGDDTQYLAAKEACGAGAAIGVEVSRTPIIYPNPSNGVFNFLQNNKVLIVEELIVTNMQGAIVGEFKNVKQFNVSQAPAGVYWYRILSAGKMYTGKIIKI